MHIKMNIPADKNRAARVHPKKVVSRLCGSQHSAADESSIEREKREKKENKLEIIIHWFWLSSFQAHRKSKVHCESQ